MKGTKRWNPTSENGGDLHDAGQSILNMLKFGEVSLHDIIQKRIAIIETTRHKSSCKKLCSIQIKVTANTPQIPDMVKAWAADCWYMWVEGEILCLINIKKKWTIVR